MKFLQSSYKILTNFSVYPARSLKTLHAYHTHHCITGILVAGHLPFSLFISAMASQQDNQGLHAQETQFREIFLSLSKGQEELRTLLMGNLAKKSPEDDKDKRLERLQAEVDIMRTQMLGQMALIQGLAREKEELRDMISQLHQDRYNMKFHQSSYPSSNNLLVYPARSLKTSHAYIHIIALQVPFYRSLIFFAVYFNNRHVC